MRVLIAVAAAVGLSSAAMADGMPERRKHAYHHAPAFSWTGFYLGLHAGWEQKRLEGSDFTAPFEYFYNARTERDESLTTDGFSGASPISQKFDGGIGGGQLGYNHQFGHVVVGTELSATWGGVRGRGNCFTAGAPPGTQTVDYDEFLWRQTVTKDCKAEQEWSLQWLQKLGVAFGSDNRLLAYVTGGVALTQVKIARGFSQKDEFNYGDGYFLDFAQSAAWSGKQYYAGVVLGGGLQYAFTDNLSLGVEYLRTTYASADTLTGGRISFTNCGEGCSTDAYSLRANSVNSIHSDTVRAVLNYKFGRRYHEEPLK